MAVPKKKTRRFFCFKGECLTLSLLLFYAPFSSAFADTVVLKNGKELKGLVVEQHTDRIVLSTEKGELPILSNSVKDVLYDEPAQNFIKIGKDYEAKGSLGEAFAYYEKALETDPNSEEARRSMEGVRSRFWASATEGPREEIEKRQIIYDAWQRNKPLEEMFKTKALKQTKELQEGLGLTLEKKDDWVRLAFVDPKKAAHHAGLKKNDRLVSIDNQSLRYLGVDVVAKKMLLPHYASFNIEFERDCFLNKEEARKMTLKELGFKLKIKREGIITRSVRSESPAGASGIKNRDLLVKVNGVSTRYMSVREAVKLIENSEEDRVVVAVRRAALLTRR